MVLINSISVTGSMVVGVILVSVWLSQLPSSISQELSRLLMELRQLDMFSQVMQMDWHIGHQEVEEDQSPVQEMV